MKEQDAVIKAARKVLEQIDYHEMDFPWVEELRSALIRLDRKKKEAA